MKRRDTQELLGKVKLLDKVNHLVIESPKFMSLIFRKSNRYNYNMHQN